MAEITFDQFTMAMRKVAGSDMDRDQKITAGRPLVESLLKNDSFLVDLLESAARTETPEGFLPSDINGFSIYRDPEKQFSMHLFVWEPHVPYPIHDHGSWGIVGVYRGRIQETKWQIHGHPGDYQVEMTPQTPHEVGQGATTYVYPLDEGPHSMRPLDQKTALTVHVYGAPVRKGMLRFFHPSFETPGIFEYYYGYPLYVYRRMLACDALTRIQPDLGLSLIDDLAKSSPNKVLVSTLKEYLDARS